MTKRNALIRLLCAALCAAMLLGTCAVPLSAKGADLPALTDDAALVDVGTAAAPLTGSPFRRTFDWFFRTFGLIGFILDPYQFTIINQKPVFQILLGFNDIYDLFTWAVNVWTDTIVCEFNHGGKDWRIQLWKGGYGLFLATGGEIGIYTKPPTRLIQHYNAPVQSDWMHLNYTIYNRGEELFSRPSPYLTGDVGPYWWAPGYRILSLCTDFLSSPRANVVMDATIQLHDAEMAKKYIAELEKKGFKPLAKGAVMGLRTPETYQLLSDGRSVRIIWQNVNEGIY